MHDDGQWKQAVAIKEAESPWLFVLQAEYGALYNYSGLLHSCISDFGSCLYVLYIMYECVVS